MIVVKLIGGLGNQMFQCAFGRALSMDLNAQLVLDITALEEITDRHTYRKFSLDKFKVINEVKVEKLNYQPLMKGFTNKIRTFISGEKNLTYVKENNYTFDRQIFNCRDNSYFDGYWQSFKYFEKHDAMIRNDFDSINELNQNYVGTYEKIIQANAVSVHVRRGDYVSSAETNAFHGVCGISYYISAMEKMRELLINPSFFIFSDDPKWVHENISGFKDVEVVSSAENSDTHGELFLMSRCRHAIIANSSFSWWGAWLINNPEKKVISPIKWFNNSDINTIDLIPENWLRI